MLTLNDFKYELPEHLIAQTPVTPRDSSRLLVVNRSSEQLSHQHFYELPEILSEKYVLVRNNTKVIPARILGQKTTGGAVEILLTRQLEITANSQVWECLTKPGLKPGQVVVFEGSSLTAECQTITGYTRDIRFNQGPTELFASLEKIGHTPLPPYITWNQDDPEELRRLYQTTFAKIPGSAAAPTAGLHFTAEVDEKLHARGIQIEEVTLHVGLGTFLPVKSSDITQHEIHQEWFELPADVAERLNAAKAAGKKILAVGTTTTRVLETCAGAEGLVAGTGTTGIYIYPPYKFKFIDALLTNFHLSQSTLLMLVSAFATQPNTATPFKSFEESLIGHAYQTAIAENYRFYSFGDAMLIM